MAKYKKREQFLEEARSYIPRGAKLTIFTTFTGRQGMTERLWIMYDGIDLTKMVGEIIDSPVNEKGLLVRGYGFDTHDFVCRWLGRALYSDDRAVTEAK